MMNWQNSWSRLSSQLGPGRVWLAECNSGDWTGAGLVLLHFPVVQYSAAELSLTPVHRNLCWQDYRDFHDFNGRQIILSFINHTEYRIQNVKYKILQSQIRGKAWLWLSVVPKILGIVSPGRLEGRTRQPSSQALSVHEKCCVQAVAGSGRQSVRNVSSKLGHFVPLKFWSVAGGEEEVRCGGMTVTTSQSVSPVTTSHHQSTPPSFICWIWKWFS